MTQSMTCPSEGWELQDAALWTPSLKEHISSHTLGLGGSLQLSRLSASTPVCRSWAGGIYVYPVKRGPGLQRGSAIMHS